MGAETPTAGFAVRCSRRAALGWLRPARRCRSCQLVSGQVGRPPRPCREQRRERRRGSALSSFRIAHPAGNTRTGVGPRVRAYLSDVLTTPWRAVTPVTPDEVGLVRR